MMYSGTDDTRLDSTEVLKREAESLAERTGCSYSLILFTGTEAFRRGDDLNFCIGQMEDYCRGKT